MTVTARENTAHPACATADRMFMHRPPRERTPASAAKRVIGKQPWRAPSAGADCGTGRVSDGLLPGDSGERKCRLSTVLGGAQATKPPTARNPVTGTLTATWQMVAFTVGERSPSAAAL